MGKTNTEIKNNFTLYTELHKKRKTVLNSPISVNKTKANHRGIQTGNTNVKHVSIKKDLIFEIEIKNDNIKDFKFKLFCTTYFNCPFFRFDSAGAAHRNNDPKISLKEQQITTPHFHEFNSDGIELAYKTKALKSKPQLTQLEDFNICVMHFCYEGNLRYKQKDFPEIKLNEGELGYKFVNEDPLKNINF